MAMRSSDCHPGAKPAGKVVECAQHSYDDRDHWCAKVRILWVWTYIFRGRGKGGGAEGASSVRVVGQVLHSRVLHRKGLVGVCLVS